MSLSWANWRPFLDWQLRGSCDALCNSGHEPWRSRALDYEADKVIVAGHVASHNSGSRACRHKLDGFRHLARGSVPPDQIWRSPLLAKGLFVGTFGAPHPGVMRQAELCQRLLRCRSVRPQELCCYNGQESNRAYVESSLHQAEIAAHGFTVLDSTH